jgi:hypothetical protein
LAACNAIFGIDDLTSSPSCPPDLPDCGAAGSCNPPWVDCNGIPGDGCETNTLTSLEHCGACGEACDSSNASATCTAGDCALACNLGFDDCNNDPSDGCETEIATDSDHCSACDTPCPDVNQAIGGVACAGGQCVYPPSCKALLDSTGNVPDGVYRLQPQGGAPFDAYCDMTLNDGGWTLILKVDGNLPGFGRDSSHWASGVPYRPEYPDLDNNEAKLAGFENMPFSELRLSMIDPADMLARHLVLAIPNAASAAVLFNAPDFETNEDVPKWHGLVAEPAYQTTCVRQGFNRILGLNNDVVRGRLAIAFDENSDCPSTDAWIGIGLDPGNDGPTCGNYGSDVNVTNGPKNTKAYCYVMIR